MPLPTLGERHDWREVDPAIAQNEGLGRRPEKSPRMGSGGKTAGAQGREMRGEIEEVLAFTLVDMALRTESLEGIENGACRVRCHGEADAGEDSAGSCRRNGRSCTLIQSD